MASGETNLEFTVKVGGLNELGQLRASVLKLKAGTVELKDASMALSQVFPKLEGEAKDIQKIFFGQATTMKMLVRNNKVFRNEIKTQVRLLRDARKETKFGGTAWKTYTRELVKARRQMSSLPLRKLGTDLRNVTNLMLKRAKDLQWVGRQMIVGITAPLGIMMRTAMQSFEAFEKQFVRTQKILGLQGTAADGLRQKMHELSTALGVSRSIVAALTADFAQMGKKMLGGTQEIQETAAEYAELTLQLEHVGQVSAQVGRDFVANLAGIIDSEIPMVIDEFGNSVVDTGNKIDYVRGLLAKFNLVENTTALSLKDLAEAFPQVSPAAKAAGIDLVFLSGVIGGMRQSGLNATESAHALKFALQRMIAPTAAVEKIVARFAGDIEGFHSDLGIGNMMLFKLAENMELLRTSPAKEEGALKYLGALVGKRQASRIYATTLALGSFQDNLKEVGEIFTDLGDQDSVWASIGHDIVTNVVDDKALKKTFERAFSTEDSVERFLLDIHNSKIALEGDAKTKLEATERSLALNKALEGLSPPMKAMVIDFMGATSAGKQFGEEFRAVMRGPAMMMQKVRNDIKNLLLEIGKTFFDAIESIIPKIQEWIQAMQKMSPAAKQAILVIGMIAAALGPLAFIFGQTSVAVSSIGRVAAGILPKMKELTRSLFLAKAMAGESLPIIRRFAGGWIDTGQKIRNAGGHISNTFRALNNDMGIATSGSFMHSVTDSAGVVSAGAASAASAASGVGTATMTGGTAVPGLPLALQRPAGLKTVQDINSAANVAKMTGLKEEDLADLSTRQLRRIRRANQSVWKNSAEDVAIWERKVKSSAQSAGDSIKKFSQGLKPIKTPAKVFPTAAGMPIAPSTAAQTTPGPSLIKMKDAMLKPFRAVGTSLVNITKRSKKAGATILKNMLSPMKILRTAAIASATGFKLSWGIALKFVKKAMLKAGPIALMVILASAIVYVVQNLDKFKKAAGPSFVVFKKALSNIIGTFKELGRIFFEIFGEVFGKKSAEGGKAVTNTMDTVRDAIAKVSQIVLGFSRVFKTVLLVVIPPIMKGLLIVIRTVVKGISALLGFLGKHWRSIAKVIIKVIYWIIKIMETYLDLTLRVVQAVVQVIRGLAKVFFWLANNVFLPVFKFAAKIFNGFLDVVLWVAEKVIEGYMAMGEVVFGILNKIFEAADKVGGFISWVSGGKLGWSFDFRLDDLETLKSGVNNVFNTIDERKDSIFEKLDGVEIGERVIDGVDRGLSAVSSGIGSVIGIEVAKSAENALNGVVNDFGEKLGTELYDGWMSWDRKKVEDDLKDLNSAVAQEAAVAYEKALIQVAVNWVSKVKSKFQKEMKKIADSAMKAFNAYAKVYLAAYDSRTAAVNETIKAEKELTKTVEYETARRELISRMALDKENFLRNRALALYEGRIEDARNLTVKFRISNDANEKNITKLDTGRAQDLLAQKRQALLDEIQAEKAAATERIQIARDTLAQKLADEQEHIVKGEDGWRDYVANINGFVADGMETAFGKDAAAAKSIEEFAQIVDDELRGKFGDMFDDAGVIDKKVTNVGPIVTREAKAWTATVGAFAADSNGMMIKMFEDVEAAWQHELEWDKWAMEAAFGREELLEEIIQLISDLEDMKTLTDKEMQEIRDSVVDNLTDMATGVEDVATRTEEAAARINSAIASIDPSTGGRYGHQPDTGYQYENWFDMGGPFPNATNPDFDMGGLFPNAPNLNFDMRGPFPNASNPDFDMGRLYAAGPGWADEDLFDYKYFGGRIKASYGRYLGGFQSSMIPVMAHGGEYVMSARAVQNIGLSKLESMNHSKNYQGGGGGGTNIFVENFIGEPEWFESMMGEYNVSVAPKNERSRGLESRKISSMADNNRRGRV